MPGMRDGNLRSGDLHEELGLFLLRAIAFVAPVPRQDDVGTDAFATLIRPEGSRRLIPDLSFLVQLKSASVHSVSYTTPDEMAWIRALDVPLLIGRVDLKAARIELFTTQRLQQILLESNHQAVELLLDPSDENSDHPNWRRTNLGHPVLAWSVAEVNHPDLKAKAFAILRPHVECLQRNRLLRGIQSHRILQWETGHPPTEGGHMMLVPRDSDIADTLRDMAPHARRLMMELSSRKKYGDFPLMLEFFDMMRRWGADPDPDGSHRMMAGIMAEGPQISVADAIHIRHVFQPNGVNLCRLPVGDTDLAAIPKTVEKLIVVDAAVTDAGVPNLLRLAGLTRLNLAGTRITDDGLLALTGLAHLEWVCVHRTQVTTSGVDLFKKERPDVIVAFDSEP